MTLSIYRYVSRNRHTAMPASHPRILRSSSSRTDLECSADATHATRSRPSVFRGVPPLCGKHDLQNRLMEDVFVLPSADKTTHLRHGTFATRRGTIFSVPHIDKNIFLPLEEDHIFSEERPLKWMASCQSAVNRPCNVFLSARFAVRRLPATTLWRHLQPSNAASSRCCFSTSEHCFAMKCFSSVSPEDYMQHGRVPCSPSLCHLYLSIFCSMAYIDLSLFPTLITQRHFNHGPLPILCRLLKNLNKRKV
jgi:hypothetical protein